MSRRRTASSTISPSRLFTQPGELLLDSVSPDEQLARLVAAKLKDRGRFMDRAAHECSRFDETRRFTPGSLRG
jgi:hypothetical protein